jgi:uroporphyrinogen-III decarboxylase
LNRARLPLFLVGASKNVPFRRAWQQATPRAMAYFNANAARQTPPRWAAARDRQGAVMERAFYQKLAQNHLCMPIGADLVLHAEPDPAAVVRDGAALGRVVEKAARRFGTPLAMPLMDLQLEKATMLRGLNLPEGEIATFHFDPAPTNEQMETLRRTIAGPQTPRLLAQVEAVAWVAQHAPDLVPCGMTIGPFSLMTKLLKDPITPVYLAGAGMTAAEEPAVAGVERGLELALLVIERSLRAQNEAGAKAIFIAEPAANKVYISPTQIESGSDVFERLVMNSLRRYKAILDEYHADLLFHCCGELTDGMIRDFCTLDPALLSLGSSRPLWEVAALVPERTVLFGNLPSKRFFSDSALPVTEVEAQARELARRMSALGRPFILGTECDVLSVPGCEQIIMRKVDAFMAAGRAARK